MRKYKVPGPSGIFTNGLYKEEFNNYVIIPRQDQKIIFFKIVKQMKKKSTSFGK